MQKALASLPGVVEVEADADTQLATCKVDLEKFDGDAALAVLAEEKFDDSSIMKTEPLKPAVADDAAADEQDKPAESL